MVKIYPNFRNIEDMTFFSGNEGISKTPRLGLRQYLLLIMENIGKITLKFIFEIQINLFIENLLILLLLREC